MTFDPDDDDDALSVCLLSHATSFPSAFGNVVEMRINTKGVGGKLPNFGFVVFDDSEPVQRILGAKVCVVTAHSQRVIVELLT